MKNKKTILVIAVILLVGLSLGYFVAAKAWGFPMFGAPSDSDSKKSEEAKTVMYSLGQFITNLLDPGKYIRATIEIEMTDGKEGQELLSKISEVKTDIYALLRSKTYEELMGESGLRDLQVDILNRIEDRCPGIVKNVYFSEFIIQ